MVRLTVQPGICSSDFLRIRHDGKIEALIVKVIVVTYYDISIIVAIEDYGCHFYYRILRRNNRS